MPNAPPLRAVSVKGVALDTQPRLKNERGEWELPGGRLEIGSPNSSVPPDSSPELALEREIQEDTSWDVKAGPLVDWQDAANCGPCHPGSD